MPWSRERDLERVVEKRGCEIDRLADSLARLETALREIADAALVQHAEWMHFHEDAIADPFAAESQAQAYAAKVSQLARVALASVTDR